jgi:glycosyltransferase involved in cell wall biosynthesis
VISGDFDARASAQIDMPWFADAATDVPVFLACGRLVDQKDYPTLLAAFAQIRSRHPVRLAILGDGPLRGALEAQVRKLGLDACIRFLGFDPNPLKYMARAFALLHSSRAEGLPGVLIQSLAVGTPVIATDCNHGPREVIREGVDGWLVPVGDAAGLARYAIELLEDPGLRARFAMEARVGARRFTYESAMPAYERALAGEPELAA